MVFYLPIKLVVYVVSVRDLIQLSLQPRSAMQQNSSIARTGHVSNWQPDCNQQPSRVAALKTWAVYLSDSVPDSIAAFSSSACFSSACFAASKVSDAELMQ